MLGWTDRAKTIGHHAGKNDYEIVCADINGKEGLRGITEQTINKFIERLRKSGGLQWKADEC